MHPPQCVELANGHPWTRAADSIQSHERGPSRRLSTSRKHEPAHEKANSRKSQRASLTPHAPRIASIAVGSDPPPGDIYGRSRAGKRSVRPARLVAVTDSARTSRDE